MVRHAAQERVWLPIPDQPHVVDRSELSFGPIGWAMAGLALTDDSRLDQYRIVVCRISYIQTSAIRYD